MQKQFRWIEDHGAVIGCLVAAVVTGAVQSPQMWRFYSDKQVSGQIAQQVRRDALIAEERFSSGCNTEFLVLGQPAIKAGEAAIDARLNATLAPGTVVCDRSGTTAVVGSDGLLTDLRNSAQIKNRFIQQRLGVKP